MDYVDIIKRAFRITWRYRALWIFGFLLSLCGGGGGGSANFNTGGGNFGAPPTGGGGDGGGEFEQFFNDLVAFFESIDPSVYVTIGIIFACFILILIVLSIIVPAVSRAALIGMVHQVEVATAPTFADGWQPDDATLSFADGWRHGWSSKAWRVFLVSLLIGIPVAVFFIVLLLLFFGPLIFAIINDSGEVALFGSIAGIVIGILLLILCGIIIQFVLWPVYELSWRQTVINEMGVIDSVRETFRLIKARFKDVGLFTLVMLAVSIGCLVVIVIVSLLLVVFGLLIGAIPGLIVYLFSESWIGALIAGGPLALILIILSTNFVSGLYLALLSTAWTLFFLDLEKDPADLKPSEPAESPPPLPKVDLVKPQKPANSDDVDNDSNNHDDDKDKPTP